MTASVQADTLIIGAGAAGLMCAATAAARGKRVIAIDHAKKIGAKIRISGGGRCNFTNIHASPADYLSQNPRFCVSALARYTPADFVKLVESYDIAYHEKTLGQLFCDNSAQDMIDMLLSECERHGAAVHTGVTISAVEKTADGFRVITENGANYLANALVIATGGLSVPKTGASGFGYRIAEQFGAPVITTTPALVPFTIDDSARERQKPLSGISADAEIACNGARSREGFLFTHRGYSGPAVLQVSSHYSPGDNVTADFFPGETLFDTLRGLRVSQGKRDIAAYLSGRLSKNLARYVCEETGVSGRIGDMSDKHIRRLCEALNPRCLRPSGTEGYRTAEVTRGGVDTDALCSKSMMCKTVPGLYFIGEVTDVTGRLGGYNFQWAWSSGVAAGRAVT